MLLMEEAFQEKDADDDDDDDCCSSSLASRRLCKLLLVIFRPAFSPPASPLNSARLGAACNHYCQPPDERAEAA